MQKSERIYCVRITIVEVQYFTLKWILENLLDFLKKKRHFSVPNSYINIETKFDTGELEHVQSG